MSTFLFDHFEYACGNVEIRVGFPSTVGRALCGPPGDMSTGRLPHRESLITVGTRSLASSLSLLFALVIGTRQVPRSG